MAEHSESRPRSGAALARTMSIHTVESGALRFAVVHASGERAPSAPASARLPDADAIMLMTSVQGEAALLVEDRRIALGLTSVCIVWPRSALDVEMPTGSSFCALSIPAELIDAATLRAEGRAERVLEMDSAAAEVLAEYLRAVAIKVGELESDTEAAYIRLAFEMANRAFGEMRGRATRADVLRSQIMQYIEAHLSDPDLGPGRIARAHFISLRYLHALFRNEGITVLSTPRSSVGSSGATSGSLRPLCAPPPEAALMRSRHERARAAPLSSAARPTSARCTRRSPMAPSRGPSLTPCSPPMARPCRGSEAC